MVDGMPAPFFLAYRISHMYGGALEGSTQNYEHLIDADTDANVLRERVNKHFALPSVIDSERGRVHFIAPFSMSSTSQTRYGGGAYSDVRIVIKPAPASAASLAEAMAYVGVKRRTFDAHWRPHLVAMRRGQQPDLRRATTSIASSTSSRRAPRRRRCRERPLSRSTMAPGTDGPLNEKGVSTWANQPGASTAPSKTGPGKSTSGGEVLGFAAAASHSYEEAEGWLIAELAKLRRIKLHGQRAQRTFDEASAHYVLTHQDKVSIDTEITPAERSHAAHRARCCCRRFTTRRSSPSWTSASPRAARTRPSTSRWAWCAGS
jgi:hypothetical protein